MTSKMLTKKTNFFFFFFFFFLNQYNYTLYKQLNKLKEANTGTKTKHTTTKHKAPDNR